MISERTSTGIRGVEETVCRVLFFDDASMEQLGTYELDPLETCLSIITGVFAAAGGQASSSGSSTAPIEYFIVGTGQTIAEEIEPSKGRILLFEIVSGSDGARRINLATEKSVEGAAFSLAMLQGKLAAGISSQVDFLLLLLLSYLVAHVWWCRSRCSV